MKKYGIRFKLLMMTSIVLAGTTILVSFSDIATFRTSYRRALQDRSVTIAKNIRAMVTRNLRYFPLENFSGVNKYLAQELQNNQGVSYYFITDRKGTILYSAKRENERIPDSSPSVARQISPSQEPVRIVSLGDYYDCALPVLEDKDSPGTIHVGIPRRLIDEKTWDMVLRSSLLSLGMLIAAIWLLGSMLRKSILKPIASLMEQVTHIANQRDLRQKLNLNRRDEIGKLGDAFDSMIDALREQANELRLSNEQLEQRVEERTAELKTANLHLQEEKDRAQEYEERLQTLIHNLPIGLYRRTAGPKGRFVMMNPAMAQMLGYENPEEVLHLPIHNFYINGDDLEAFSAKLIRDKQVIGEELPLRRADGSTIWTSVTAKCLSDENGTPQYFDGTVENITERKKADARLKAAMEQAQAMAEAAESANLAKSEFLANMSHEIRTPMNGVMGMTELALQTELNEQQRSYLEIAYESAETLLTIINDILDFSKIEAGRMELVETEMNLRKCLAAALTPMTLRAEQKGLALLLRVEENVPTYLLGDSVRLRQIVTNLVNNALKFTDAGEIRLTVERALPPQTPDKERVELHFSVKDTGIGIAPERRRAIFEAFEQGDNTTVRRYGGTGLGLSICARLVEMMEGRIWLESELGKGSTFHFTAGFQNVAAPSEDEQPSDKLSGVRVLVMDNDPANCRIVDETLRGWGMEPTTVAGVPEAMKQLRAAQHEAKPYRLVLSDMGLPEQSVFDLAEEILNDASLDDIPIILLSSPDQTVDRIRVKKYHISECLAKPLHRGDLLHTIENTLTTTPATPRNPFGKQSPRMAERRILLVEDNLVNQQLAVAILKRAGHEVVVANNGREGIDAWRKQPFDAILMDVQMPDMDGLVATRRIREIEHRQGGHTPIIAMTAHAMVSDKDRCLEAGMDGYVSKPIQIKAVIRELNRVLDESPAPAKS